MPTPTVIACVIFLAGAILLFALVAAAKTRDAAMSRGSSSRTCSRNRKRAGATR